MAKFFPESIHSEQYWANTDPNDPKPDSEKLVYLKLKEFSDDWTVIHGLRCHATTTITARGKGKIDLPPGRKDIESDFILIHPEKGVLFVEVKGGVISIDKGLWYSTDRGGKRHKIKVPAVQAMNAMHGFNNYLSNNLEEPYGSGNLMASFAYCAVFPDIQLGKDDWAPNSPRSLMVGKEDFPNFEQRVYEILEGQTYKKPGAVLCRLIRTALMPSISIKRKRYSKGSVEIIEEQISRLTEAQFNGWAQLRANKRMIIRGIAGSGKTVIAEEIAKELSTEGLSVLLLCYNKRLREWIQEDLKGTDITVRTYHSLCKELCSKAGLDQPEFDEDYWDSGFQQFFEDAVEVAGVTYDAIIIDEGQDFHENWFENLELLLEDSADGYFHIFTDSRQDIFRVGCKIPEQGAAYWDLPNIVRNTRQIGKKVIGVHGGKEKADGADGTEPLFKEVSTQKQLLKATKNEVEKLFVSGNDADDMKILCDDQSLVNALMAELTEKIGPHAKEIEVTTVGLFKGLESKFVVIILPLKEIDHDKQNEFRNRWYTGMSRAKAELTVIGTSEHKKILKWDES